MGLRCPTAVRSTKWQASLAPDSKPQHETETNCRCAKKNVVITTTLSLHEIFSRSFSRSAIRFFPHAFRGVGSASARSARARAPPPRAQRLALAPAPATAPLVQRPAQTRSASFRTHFNTLKCTRNALMSPLVKPKLPNQKSEDAVAICCNSTAIPLFPANLNSDCTRERSP